MARAQGHGRKIFEFDARPGGSYRMAFVYEKAAAGRGRSTEDAGIFTAGSSKSSPRKGLSKPSSLKALTRPLWGQ